MAERDDRQRTNDPVTSPAAEDRPGTSPETADRLPRQSEMNASHMDKGEAESRGQAKESGRSVAKLFGIGLVVLVAFVVLAVIIGGGDDEPTAAEEVGAEPAE